MTVVADLEGDPAPDPGQADADRARPRVPQRIVQRHSGAGRVRVRLARTGRRVTLEVGDDGHGFTPEAPAGGVGLASMRQRATNVGGALTIKSGPAGTLVRMTVPAQTAGDQ